MHTVYLIENLVSGKFYTGQTCNEVTLRWGQHKSDLRRNKHGNRHLQGAWNKYDEDSFSFYEFDTYLAKEESNVAEKALKNWFSDLDICYNIREGGEMRTVPLSEETRRKISETQKGRKCPNLEAFHSPEARAKAGLANLGRKQPPRTDEFREKQRQSHLGKPGHWRGKTRPEETREKLRHAHLGLKHTPETKAKIGQAAIGRKMPPCSNALREKRRQAQLGKPSPMKGKKQSPEAIEKTRQANLGRKQSKETVEKRRQANLGKKRSEEFKVKARQARMNYLILKKSLFAQLD